MAVARVISDVQTVAGLATLDIIPAAGFVFEITEIGSSAWVGVPPNTIPQVDVGLFDGLLGPANFLTAANVRGRYRPQHFLINNGNYLRITNANAGAQQISYSGIIRQVYGTGAGSTICYSDIQQIAPAGTFDIRPAAGFDMVLKDIGSSQWIGAPPAALPDVTVALNDGVNTANILEGANTRMWESELEIFINNANYVTIANTNVAQADIGYSLEMVHAYGTAASNVMSSVVNCLGGATVDFRPAVGEEWRVTGFGAATFTGVAPLAFPDVTVSMFDGVLLSTLSQVGDWKNNGHMMNIHINNGNYLRFTDTSGVAQDVCVIAERDQVYA